MPATEIMSCDCCATEVQVADIVEANPVYWREPLLAVCPTCRDANFFQCDDCDDWFHINNRRNGPEGSFLCGECIGSYFTCSECDIIMHIDNCCEDNVCHDCYQNSDESTLIHEYSYRPRPTFFGDGPHYMGVELEVEVVRGELDVTAKKTLELLGTDFAYLKHDGSINNGFEIVTHPASLKSHKEKWVNFFKNRPNGMRSYDVDNCGLHVHASRDCLKELTIGKMLAFVNSANNAKFIKGIAQRESRDYAALKPSKKISDVRRSPDTRYEAINLLPQKTVEFRIFKGTLNEDSFYRALEFVQCLIEFCKPSNHSISDCIGTEAFFRFVKRLHPKAKKLTPEQIEKFDINEEKLAKRAGPYPNLWKFIQEFQEKLDAKAKLAEEM